MAASRLVISLLNGESVQIGENILITLVRDGKGKTRISFEAPKDIRIERNKNNAKKKTVPVSNLEPIGSRIQKVQHS